MTSSPIFIPDVIRKKMARLYDKEGLSVAMLKERFGYGYALISKVLHEEGVVMRDARTRVHSYSSGQP